MSSQKMSILQPQFIIHLQFSLSHKEIMNISHSFSLSFTNENKILHLVTSISLC
jgi:hypothetical protein